MKLVAEVIAAALCFLIGLAVRRPCPPAVDRDAWPVDVEWQPW